MQLAKYDETKRIYDKCSFVAKMTTNNGWQMAGVKIGKGQSKPTTKRENVSFDNRPYGMVNQGTMCHISAALQMYAQRKRQEKSCCSIVLHAKG